MAESKKIMIDVEVNTSGGLEGVNKGIDETKQRVKSLKTETDKTSKAMQNGFKAGADAASIIPGPIGQAASAMQGLTGGIGKVVGAFNTLKGALIATGIGAFVVIVGTLITYFTETEKGAQKLRVAMAGVGTVVRTLFDAWVSMAKATYDFWTFNWKGAAKNLTDAFNTATTGLVNNTQAAIANSKALNLVEEAEGDLTVKRAEANKEIAKARILADDLTLSTEERIAAVKQAGQIEESVAKEELQIAAMKLKALEDNMNRKKDASEEERDQVDQAKVRLADLERESIMRQKRLGSEVQGLKNEQTAIDKERDAERLAKLKERNDKEIELEKQKSAELEVALKAQYENELRLAQEAAEGKLLTDEYLAERRAVTAEEQLALDIEKALAAEDAKFQAVMEALFQQDATKAEYEEAQELYEQEQMQIKNDLQYEFDQKKLTDAEKLEADLLAVTKKAGDEKLAAEKKIRDARLAIGSSLASGLGSLGQIITAAQGEQTAASKVFALGQLAINTAMSISSAIAGATESATATGPGAVVATPVFIATQIATVLAAVAQASTILASVPGGGSPSIPTSAASIGASAPQITPVTTNTTQLGNTQQAELAPVQAYVVETQITGSQTNINQIESQSTFGGG
jgi:hypothetical protein